MRVVVPYAKLFPETKAALDATGRDVEYVNVGTSMTAYHELFLELWHSGQGWINVEQDIVVYPGAIEELEQCSCLWGGKPYWLGSVFGAYLGLTKFSDELVRENPGVMDALDGLRDDGTPRRYFGRLDTRLGQVLNDQVGIAIDVHWPAVQHRNPDKQMRGGMNCVECGRPIPWRVLRLGPPWPCDHDSISEPIPEVAIQPPSPPSIILNCVYCGGPYPCSKH
jgi:hypothetical protein